MKRILIYAGMLLSAMALGSTFQPLNHLQALANPAQQGNCQTFKESGKQVCGKFLAYWQSHGGLAQQGFPISNEFREKSDLNGQEYTVQYFERAVFELHPELPAPNDVLLSQLGTFWARSKYGNPPRFPGEGAPQPTAVPTPFPKDVKVPLAREGVIITFKSVDFRGPTGGGLYCNGTHIVWEFVVENTSKAPYTFPADLEKSVFMVDSTGKKSGLCRGPVGFGTINPSQTQNGVLVIGYDSIPSTATHLDLQVTIEGKVLTFRHSLK